MLEHLRPSSENHSISRVIASIFVPQAFIKPDDILENLKKIKHFNSYPKKGVLKNTNIRFNNGAFNVLNDPDCKGFIFENYDSKGGLDSLFKLENTHNDTKSVISLEKRNYTRWDDFKAYFKKDLDHLLKAIDFYVSAISLNYRDEFDWNSETNITVDQIFNTTSELLNKKFLSSKNGTLVLISQGKEKNIFEEKTEISFNNDLKKIVIDHTYAIRLEDYILLGELRKKGELFEIFDIAHEENKSILKNVLTNETQKLIKII
ncbi:TIGR04255 family protein [Winogradskyella poriferorum]|uniref:TIGR04255 family protein n=1 Tax=Winogradskyella poriferorum TaxID=307627 RepID=UPI003D66172C